MIIKVTTIAVNDHDDDDDYNNNTFALLYYITADKKAYFKKTTHKLLILINCIDISCTLVYLFRVTSQIIFTFQLLLHFTATQTTLSPPP